MVTQRQIYTSAKSFKAIESEAIDHALEGRWDEAVSSNLAGLGINTNDVGCHNRLAKAYIELSRYTEARKHLKYALSVDPINRVAKRQLERLSNLDSNGVTRRTSGGGATNSALFISDPAVATVSELKKVAEPDVLASVSPGDKLKMSIDRVITLSTKVGDYVGTMEVRLATRLSNLIATGNKYEVLAAKLSDSEVIVVVRETKRSADNERTASFPSYLQKKIGDFDIDDPMDINDEVRMEDDIDEMLPEPGEGDAMKSILRGDFGNSGQDASLNF